MDFYSRQDKWIVKLYTRLTVPSTNILTAKYILQDYANCETERNNWMGQTRLI